MTPELPPVAGLNPTLVLILSILGALVPIMSLFSSMLNSSIRTRTDKGEKISPALTFFAGVLNFIAMNLDKGIQMMRMSNGQTVATTVTTPVAPAPAPVEPPKP